MYDNRVGDTSLDSVVFGDIAIMFGKNRYICIGLTIKLIIMKRVLLSLVMLCVVAATAIAGVPQKKPNAPKRANINLAGYELWGDVEKVVAYDYEIDEKGKTFLFASEIFIFTERGDVASYEYYDENGDLLCSNIYHYDEQGREIESIYQGYNKWASEPEYEHTSYLEDGTEVKKYADGSTLTTTREFNERGDIVAETQERDGEVKSQYTYRYLYEGDRIIVKETFIGDVSVDMTVYTYDVAGNITSTTFFHNDEISHKWVMNNDKRGNNVEESWYDKNGNVTDTYKYKYDKQGNLTELLRYWSNETSKMVFDSKKVFEIVYR